MTPFPQPTDKAAEDGYLQLGSVCQLLIVGNYRFAHDYGCMHPGMPPGRIHSRRSRDAPIYTACASAVLHSRPEPVSIAATAKARLRQFPGDRFQRSIFNLSGWQKEVNPQAVSARAIEISASRPNLPRTIYTHHIQWIRHRAHRGPQRTRLAGVIADPLLAVVTGVRKIETRTGLFHQNPVTPFNNLSVRGRKR